MKFKHICLVSICVLAMVSCSQKVIVPEAMVVFNPDTIIVRVSQSKAEFDGNGNNRCKAQNRYKAGCVRFNANEYGHLTFGQKGQKGWAFTTIQICKLNSGGGENCNLKDNERMEFGATNEIGGKLVPPDQKGFIQLKDHWPDLYSFLLYNENTFEQNYYYRIKLCKGGVCHWADPPIENKGRN